MLKGIDETQQIHNICILKSTILAITELQNHLLTTVNG